MRHWLQAQALQCKQADDGRRVPGPPTNTVVPTEANSQIMDSVLQRARLSKDPADYVRLLSHDPSMNILSKNLALPTLLMADALSDGSLEHAQTREHIIDALRNLQRPSVSDARPVSAMPNNNSAYPLWYNR